VHDPGCPERGLTTAQLERFRLRLVKERQELLDLYQRDVHAGRDIRTHGAEDWADLASMDDARDLLFSFSNQEREELQQIDEAMARIDAGTYGLCLHDGEPIAVARLEAIPWVRFCGEHQEMSEQGILEEGRETRETVGRAAAKRFITDRLATRSSKLSG